MHISLSPLVPSDFPRHEPTVARLYDVMFRLDPGFQAYVQQNRYSKMSTDHLAGVYLGHKGVDSISPNTPWGDKPLPYPLQAAAGVDLLAR